MGNTVFREPGAPPWDIVRVDMFVESERERWFERVKPLHELFLADDGNAFPFRFNDPDINVDYYDDKIAWLALDADEVCGMLVAGEDEDSGNCTPYAFYVRPEYRGRGIGADLFRRMVDLAASAGHGVELCVLNCNRRARKLYEKFGLISYAQLMYAGVSGG